MARNSSRAIFAAVSDRRRPRIESTEFPACEGRCSQASVRQGNMVSQSSNVMAGVLEYISDSHMFKHQRPRLGLYLRDVTRMFVEGIAQTLWSPTIGTRNQRRRVMWIGNRRAL